MKSITKAAVVGSAAGALILAGATGAMASTPTTAPTGSPVDCVAPAVADPAGTLKATLGDPAGSLQKDAACLSGQG